MNSREGSGNRGCSDQSERSLEVDGVDQDEIATRGDENKVEVRARPNGRRKDKEDM